MAESSATRKFRILIWETYAVLVSAPINFKERILGTLQVPAETQD